MAHLLSSTRYAARRPAARRSRLGAMLGVWRSRQALGALDADRLRDLGLSAEEARAEAARPIWDVPATWLR